MDLRQLLADFQRLPKNAPYSEACQVLDALRSGYQAAAAAWFGPILEREIDRRVRAIKTENAKCGEPDYLSLAQKKRLSMWINEELRQRGMSICREGRACTLWAAPCEGSTPQGHFRLAIGRPKEKSFSHKDFSAYFPLVLIPSPPRKEGGTRWSERSGSRGSSEEQGR
jgi:hypothetical protein